VAQADITVLMWCILYGTTKWQYLMCVSVCMYVTTVGVVSTVAGNSVSGYVDGVGTGAKFNHPIAISADSIGNVWLTDTWNNMIRQINTAGKVH